MKRTDTNTFTITPKEFVKGLRIRLSGMEVWTELLEVDRYCTNLDDGLQLVFFRTVHGTGAHNYFSTHSYEVHPDDLDKLAHPNRYNV